MALSLPPSRGLADVGASFLNTFETLAKQRRAQKALEADNALKQGQLALQEAQLSSDNAYKQGLINSKNNLGPMVPVPKAIRDATGLAATEPLEVVKTYAPAYQSFVNAAATRQKALKTLQDMRGGVMSLDFAKGQLTDAGLDPSLADTLPKDANGLISGDQIWKAVTAHQKTVTGNAAATKDIATGNAATTNANTNANRLTFDEKKWGQEYGLKLNDQNFQQALSQNQFDWTKQYQSGLLALKQHASDLNDKQFDLQKASQDFQQYMDQQKLAISKELADGTISSEQAKSALDKAALDFSKQKWDEVGRAQGQADIAHTNAETTNLQSQTNERNALLPGKLKQQAADYARTGVETAQITQAIDEANQLLPFKLKAEDLKNQQLAGQVAQLLQENAFNAQKNPLLLQQLRTDIAKQALLNNGIKITNDQAALKLAQAPEQFQMDMQKIQSEINNNAASSVESKARASQIEAQIAQLEDGTYADPAAARAFVAALPKVGTSLNVDDFIIKDGPHAGKVDMTLLASTAKDILSGQQTAANTARTTLMTPLIAAHQRNQNEIDLSNKTSIDLQNQIDQLNLNEKIAGEAAAGDLWKQMNLPGVPKPNLSVGDLLKIAKVYAENGPGSQVTLRTVLTNAGLPLDGYTDAQLDQPRTVSQLNTLGNMTESFLRARGVPAKDASEIVRNLASASRGSVQTTFTTGPKGELVPQQTVNRPDITPYVTNPVFSPYLQGQGVVNIPPPQTQQGTGGTPTPAPTAVTAPNTLPTWNSPSGSTTLQDAINADHGDIGQTLSSLQQYKNQMPANAYNAWHDWLTSQHNGTPAATLQTPTVGLPDRFDPIVEAQRSIEVYGDPSRAIQFWQDNMKNAQDSGLSPQQVQQVISELQKHLPTQQPNPPSQGQAPPTQQGANPPSSFMGRLNSTEHGIIGNAFNVGG